MGRSIIDTIVTAVSLKALMEFAARAAPRKSKGTRALTWPAGAQLVAVLSLLVGVFLSCIARYAGPEQALAAVLMCGSLVLGSLYLAYCTFFYRVWWTAEGISAWHPLWGRRFIRWDELASARYIASLQMYVVRGGDERIWYWPVQAGYTHLNRLLGRRLHPVSLPDAVRAQAVTP